MLIPNELLAVGLACVGGMQSWTLKELVKLKVAVGKLETKIDILKPK